MPDPAWTAIDNYVTDVLSLEDDALRAAVQASDHAALPAIQVSPPQGKLLHLLAKAIGARTILEIGALGGYSTIWLARALPADGRLITLEAESRHAAIARESVRRAGLDQLVEVRVGPALGLLPSIDAEGIGPFDFIFIDADKVNTPRYFAWAVEHTRPKGIIVADNVVRKGKLLNDEDESAAAQRQLHLQIAADLRVSATTIQMVGVKGYDGFTLALVAGTQ